MKVYFHLGTQLKCAGTVTFILLNLLREMVSQPSGTSVEKFDLSRSLQKSKKLSQIET